MNTIQELLNNLKQKNIIFLLIPGGAILLMIILIISLVSQNRQTYHPQPTISPTTYLQPSPTPTTPVIPGLNPTEQEKMKSQTQADLKYSKYIKDIYTNYPWYNSLPLQTTSYFVYFDPNKKSFTGKLYPKSSTTTSVDQQVALMKSEILEKLKNLSIPTTTYPFDWQVTQQP